VFNCTYCGNSFGPKISPVHVVTGVRPAAYHNEFYREDEWGNRELVKVDSTGTEITGESLACNGCAKVESPVANGLIVIGGKTFQEKQADPLRVKFIASAIDRMLTRLEHKSKRAKRDTETVVPSIKQFVDENKGFVF